MSKTKCLTCEEEFFPRQYNQRFCCKACNDAHYNAERSRAMELLRAQTFLDRDPVPTEPPLGIDIETVPEEARQ
jgi:hypothetical protein